MRRTSARWQPIWPLLAVLGALSAFGLGALVGVAGPSRSQVLARHEQVTGALDGVLFYLRDAEEAERDFLLTGRPGDLRRAGAAAAAARDACRRLRREASEEPEQQRRVERLDALLARRLAKLEGEIAQRRQAPPGRAWIRLSGRDQAELGRIRQLAGEVRRAERRVLQQRLERADTGRQVIAFISGGAGLLLFVLLPLAIWYSGRSRRQLADSAAQRQRAESSLAILAEAGTLLAGSLDFDVTLGNVARLAVATLADFCFCDLLDEEGQVERVTWAHRDPERQRALEGAWRFLPPADVEHHPVARTLRTGRAQLVPVVAEAWLRGAAPTEEHYRFLQELELHSLITVPVGTEERPLGALTFCRAARGGRPYEEADLELAKELGRRAGVAVENARLYRATQQANAAKDQFLATLSHELRTPLTPVLAVVSALEEDRRLPAEVRQRLATVRRNTELEARLIDDLLDLTRIERGKLDLHREVTDVLPLLAHAVEACRTPESEEKALRLVTELAADDHRVWADGSRLSQVLWNLLKNAVKFTPEGGAIRVRSWNEGEAEAAERWLVVEVADTGIGIEPQLLPRVFDAFEQGQETITRRYGGLGLGLAISRAIAELHGGTLEAASEGRDRGSTFTMRLPLGLPAHAIPRPPMGADLGEITLGVPVLRPLHVLLVEDHQDTADAMADLLRASGHQVTVAGSVDEALAAAAAAGSGEKGKYANGGAIDLVVSDLGLPDGSGYDLMRELAGRYGLRGIALSGYGMDEDVRQSREAGFERHLTKPVDLRTLEAAIRDSAPPLVS